VITLPELDDTQKLKLSELHRLTVETHAAVVRMEATHTGNAETLKKIEANTATVAQFFEQLDTVTKLAAGKNQVPMTLFIACMVLVAVYMISDNLKDGGPSIRVPWLGIEIESSKGVQNANK
jgi:hypothetical protein